MKTILSRTFAALGFLFCGTVAALAQVTFTINGTANSADLGYTLNQAVTFTFVLNDFQPTTAVGDVSASAYTWRDELTSHPELWADISGTGLGGTWTRPNGSSTAPNSFLQMSNNSSLRFFATTDSGPDPASDTGMTVGGGNLWEISLKSVFLGLDLSSLGDPPLPDPTFYFSSRDGTYTVHAGLSAGMVSSVTRGGAVPVSVEFTLTSLTISAIPEPGTYATIFGAAAFGLVVLRRRMKPARG